MTKRIIIAAGLAAVVLAGSAFAALRRERGGFSFAERIVNRLTNQLDLTDAQQNQVRAILDAERVRVAPLMAAAAANRKQLHELTAGGKFDETQVRAIAAKQAQTMTDLIVERERVKARIYNEVLTPEQRTRADALLERIQQRFGERAGRNAETVPIVP
jgi:Spy/CpxP family protein refolding chaperone